MTVRPPHRPSGQRRVRPMERVMGPGLRYIAAISVIVLLLWGCAGRQPVSSSAPEGLRRLGFTIQVGAFTQVDNAWRLTQALESRGLDAFYFRHASGLYKVRFGNYPTLGAALAAARALKAAGTIADFYIINPGEYPLAAQPGRPASRLREDLVHTARGFIGIPYRWGGTSVRDGFDCSGLAMAVYRLNGLDLPRTSREQYRAGQRVPRSRLKKGDLVFFATGRSKRVSHVGIYTGRNRFIHAPGKGKHICTSSLSSDYYRTRYVGARTYVR